MPNAHATAPFSRIWLLVHKYQGSENRARYHAHKRLRPVVRIKPKKLSVNYIEDDIKTIYRGDFNKNG